MFLQVCAGLANRLRATVSGICAAEDLNVPLVISWPVEAACAATFTDLFEPFPRAKFCSTQNHGARMCLSPADWEREKVNSVITIKSYGQFHQSDPERWLQTLRSLKPRAEFTEYMKQVGSNVIGVHIRRTDNMVSRKKSPTAAFIDAMNKYPEDTVFFVATDDINEWETLLRAFSAERLVRAASDYSRNTLEGIRAAFVDFLCLASCKEILGSTGSSFSEVAGMYSGVPVHFIQAP